VVATEPFLRAPPFPWVAAEVAAVSAPGRTPIADPVGLLVQLREARVGGAFWLPGGRNPWLGDGPVRAAPDDDRAIAAWLSGRAVRAPDGQELADATLAHAALERIASASYRDPFSGRATHPRATVALLAEWRDLFAANRAVGTAVGMAAWKHEAITQFLWDGVRAPRFAAPPRAGNWPGAVAYWPSRVDEGFAADLERRGHEAWAIEDGFLRSNGLGAECHPPMSVIVDRSGGLYFDPSRPSELERILATAEFDGPLLERAARLRTAIVAARLGKYGVDPAPALGGALPRGRRIVLAVGQVDDDLSVARGGAGIPGNAAFLDRVRREEPGAFVVYRPHPDVAAGLRRGKVPDPVAAGLVDRVVTGGSLLALVERADAVHVLSSLTGFEALLRGREVIVHGQPFYAGWGLTRDLAPPVSRRGRSLSLDALVAGALILTPRYRDPVTLLPCPVEVLVARLAAGEGRPASALTGLRRALGRTRSSLARKGAA
jgi:capsular polysaccharide export protein